MNPSQIRKLYDAMTEGGYNLLEMKTPFSRIRLFVPPGMKAVEEPDIAETVSVTGPILPKKADLFSERVGIFSFKTPLEVGAQLKKGQVLGIIKGISIQDQVISPCSGKILTIHIKNGEIVEFGKLLFTIEPEEKSSR